MKFETSSAAAVGEHIVENNTVYFIDTTGFDANGQPLACPTGVGLPSATAALPAAPIFYDATKLQTSGVVPYNM